MSIILPKSELMKEYEKETGKNALNSKETKISSLYIKWKEKRLNPKEKWRIIKKGEKFISGIPSGYSWIPDSLLDIQKTNPPLIVHSVGNGSPRYPGNFTLREIQIITYFTKKNHTLHLFSGKSSIGNVRIDYSCKEATTKADVFKWLKNNTQQFKVVVLDPPYNTKFGKKYKEIGNTPEQFIVFDQSQKTTELFFHISRYIKPQFIILKSWNYYIPKGYRDIGSYCGYAGAYRKPTFLMITKKK